MQQQENDRKKQKQVRKVFVILFWLIIWQGLALCVHNKILLVGPMETGICLVQQMGTTGFWLSIFITMLRIMFGFILAFSLGCILAVFAYRWRFLSEVLQPLMNFLKTVPVASFVVLFLIWWKSEFLSVAVVFVVALPLIYISVLEECRRLDPKLNEVATVYGIGNKKKFFYLLFPQMRPGILTVSQLALGMSYKSGLAAEMIGTPARSVGQQMYFAKISLDTGYLFAYTAAIIFVAYLSERLFCRLLQGLFAIRPVQKNKRRESSGVEAEGMPSIVEVREMQKSYGLQTVLDHVSMTFSREQWNYLTWDSGKGKTTLFRILAGLEKADEGEVYPEGVKCTMMFQENRLMEEESAIMNVCLTAAGQEEAREHLLQVLDEEAITKKVVSLSGGMQRRVALVRAVLSEGDVLLLDEPFTGLDEDSKRRVEQYIEKNRRNRIIIVATHEAGCLERTNM